METDGEGIWASEVIALGNIHNRETIVLKTETGGEGWFSLNGLQLICDVAGNESFDDF